LIFAQRWRPKELQSGIKKRLKNVCGRWLGSPIRHFGDGHCLLLRILRSDGLTMKRVQLHVKSMRNGGINAILLGYISILPFVLFNPISSGLIFFAFV